MDIESNVEFRYYSMNSDHLIVWFGGINEPFFSGKLSNESGFDQISFIDAAKNWYTNGILSTHESVADGVSYLLNIIMQHKYAKVIFCGQSSGGYAALLYGFHLKVDLCILFSPQTRNFFNGQCMMVPSIKLVDVGDLYANNPGPNLVFNVGRSEGDHENEFYWDDWRQLSKFLSFDCATFIRHPYDNHSISVLIKNNGNLYRFVSGLIKAFL